MAFNSHTFLLVFLPLAVALYRAAGRWRGRRARLVVLIALSLGFVALGAPRALVWLAGSLAGNFALARLIGASAGAVRHRWLTLGVVANVGALVLVKYGAVLALAVAGPGGPPPLLAPLLAGLALPLGLSFYTFQQIAFLVDTARGRIARAPLLTYLASILFFPTLVSGPITLYREFAPQAEAGPAPGRAGEDITVGLVLVIIGLFKKSVIADTMALWVDPLFGAAAGHVPGAGAGWLMVAGFLLQMYFDFSGYSDMALGVARMLGIRLPLNFMSPLRVTSIIDWWRRWHMSLGRFVGEYVFQPLALPLTRRAMRRGLGRRGVQAAGVLLPTAVAMVVIGAWHGGNWTFVVFGLLHAAYMVIAETWRFARRKVKAPPRWWHAPAGNALTLLAVLVALAPFRAADMASAMRLWAGMAGLGAGDAAFAVPIPGGVAMAVAELAAGLAICWLLPASARLLDGWEPALEWHRWRTIAAPVELRWAPDARWGAALGVLLFAGLAFISRGTAGFVYGGF